MRLGVKIMKFTRNECQNNNNIQYACRYVCITSPTTLVTIIRNYSKTRGDREKRISDVDSSSQNWLSLNVIYFRKSNKILVVYCLVPFFQKFRFFRILSYRLYLFINTHHQI